MMAIDDSGVCVAGRATTVQPAAKAAEILRPGSTEGKFHGEMATATPSGCRIT